jgi:hypothetical protein
VGRSSLKQGISERTAHYAALVHTCTYRIHKFNYRMPGVH